jgi:hypothetical protein
MHTAGKPLKASPLQEVAVQPFLRSLVLVVWKKLWVLV